VTRLRVLGSKSVAAFPHRDRAPQLAHSRSLREYLRLQNEH
jgi:hypothetical protein